MKTVMVDGVTYIPQEPNGNRAVVVVDRGWIFAGDVTEENGRIFLDRAVWVFRWERIGFAAVIENPKRDGIDIRPLPTRVDIPAGAEVFRLPVDDGWGL
jgi:hypothetical protein